MRQLLLIAAVLAVSAAAQAQKGAPRIVCWTDESGRRACGDRVPPQYASSERQVIDGHGRVVETRPRELTPAEQQARERELAEAEAEQRRQAEQVAYDRFLLQSYSAVGDLQRARQDRLDTLDARLQLAIKAEADTRKTVDQLQQRAAAAQDDQQAQKLLADYRKSLADTGSALAALRKERQGVCDSFARDVRRFEQLKGLPESAPPVCPPL